VLEPALRAAALLEHLPDGILLLDREGIICWVAPSAQRQGLNRRELLGRPAGEALHGGDALRFQAGLNEALARPGTAVTVEGLQQSGGRAGYADDTLTFLPDTEGINGVILVLRARARSQPLRDRLAHSGLIGVFDHDHLTAEVYWLGGIARVDRKDGAHVAISFRTDSGGP
jgi:PAS domain S-box-containing protein